MKFVKAPDHDENGMYQRLVSEDGKIEIGIYPVMFGYRVRAGFVGDGGCHIDWCGGGDQAQVELLYSICKNILENKGTFNGMPSCSRVKPFYNDKEFVGYINGLVTKPLEVVRLTPLGLDKMKMLDSL